MITPDGHRPPRRAAAAAGTVASVALMRSGGAAPESGAGRPPGRARRGAAAAGRPPLHGRPAGHRRSVGGGRPPGEHLGHRGAASGGSEKLGLPAPGRSPERRGGPADRRQGRVRTVRAGRGPDRTPPPPAVHHLRSGHRRHPHARLRADGRRHGARAGRTAGVPPELARTGRHRALRRLPVAIGQYSCPDGVAQRRGTVTRVRLWFC